MLDELTEGVLETQWGNRPERLAWMPLDRVSSGRVLVL